MIAVKKALDQIESSYWFDAVPGAMAFILQINYSRISRYSLDVQNDINLGTAEVSDS